jgi:hypothetical protein
MRTYLYPFIGLVLLLGIILLVFYERHSSAIVDATTHQPQSYTELYFSDPNRLPAVAPADQRLPLAFTIHNVEGRDVGYSYKINFTGPNGQTTLLRQGQVTVAAGQVATVNDASVQLPAYGGRAELSVILVGHPEAIHFWIESQL